MAAGSDSRPGVGRLRAHRARGGLGRGRHPHHGPAREWRVGDQRQQAIHHQLGHRDHLAGHRHRGHRKHRGWQEGDLKHHRAQRHTGIHRRTVLQQGRLERVGHSSAHLRRRPRPRGKSAGGPRHRLRELLVHLGRGPHRDRRAGHRSGAGLRRRERQVREGASGVRPADRLLPGDQLQDRADGGTRPRRAHGVLRCGGKDVGGKVIQEGGGDREDDRVGGGDGQRPRRHPDPWRIRLHERVSGGTPLP